MTFLESLVNGHRRSGEPVICDAHACGYVENVTAPWIDTTATADCKPRCALIDVVRRRNEEKRYAVERFATLSVFHADPALTGLPAPPRISTGIAGLDEILAGGLTRDRLYLVEGTPGTGKTTLSLQFLLEGSACGETGLYITLSETADELRAVAATHGWSLDTLSLFELVSDMGLDPDSEQTVLHLSALLQHSFTTPSPLAGGGVRHPPGRQPARDFCCRPARHGSRSAAPVHALPLRRQTAGSVDARRSTHGR